MRPIRVVVVNDDAVEAVVAMSDLGRYVAVDVRTMDTELARARPQEEEEDDGKGTRLYQSIYETALRNQVPRPLIEDLVRIYSYDVDFQRRVQSGNSFEVLFAGEDESSEKSEVLFASLTTGGETRKYYRFQSSDDGLVDFYDETGKSAKKFLVRKPLAAGIVRSPYGMRHHPLLRFTKMHTGVDWAAPWARRSTLRAMASSRRWAGKAVTAATSASGTPTATRPLTATCPLTPAIWKKASAFGRAR